jgi:hypothetical protein
MMLTMYYTMYCVCIVGVHQAIAFVEEHKDELLWEELIQRSLKSPDFLSNLLEHVLYATLLLIYHTINMRLGVDDLDDLVSDVYRLVVTMWI